MILSVNVILSTSMRTSEVNCQIHEFMTPERHIQQELRHLLPNQCHLIESMK